MEKTAAGMKKTNKTHVVYKKTESTSKFTYIFTYIHIKYIYVTYNAKVMGEFFLK